MIEAIYALAFANAMLCVIIAVMIGSQKRERKDLYDRIMSKNLPEYKHAGEAPKHVKSAHEEVLARWRDKTIK